jgi:YggT family protein
LTLFVHIIGYALFVFWLLLIARVVMSVTDPPVKLLRRLIPQLTVGAVRFDLSIMVLLLLAFVGMTMAIDYHV